MTITNRGFAPSTGRDEMGPQKKYNPETKKWELTQSGIDHQYVREYTEKVQASIKSKRTCKTCNEKFPTPVNILLPKYYQDGVIPCRPAYQAELGEYVVYKNTGKHRFCSSKCSRTHESNRKDGWFIEKYVFEKPLN